MSKHFILQNLLLIMLFSICTVLLGFVGIYAFNKDFQLGIVLPFSPTIYCVIEYSTVDPEDGEFLSTDWNVIFDNYFQNTFIETDIIEKNADDTMSIKTSLEGAVNSTFYLKITNYTENMVLKSSINSLTVNGEVNNDLFNANTLVSVSSEQTEYMTVTVMGDSPTNEMLLSLLIQKAYLVDFASSSNLLNENFYTASSEDVIIDLNTQKGTFLPETITVSVNDTELNAPEFTYSKEDRTITIANENITGDIAVDCDATIAYIINEYTTGTKPTGHDGTNPVTYNYYVEMGQYPQSIKNAGVSVTGVPTNGSVGIGSDGESYIYTTSSQSELTGWYKVEPLKWVVIGTSTESTYALSELYYNNGVFYTDSRKGKPYTEGLLLMSELAVDGYAFDDENTYFSSSNSNSIYNFLNTTFAQTCGLQQYFSVSETPNNNLISYQTMTTYGYTSSAMDYYDATANVFLLGGIYEVESDKTAQTYYYKNYFSNGVYGTSVATTSPTAYALAHDVYTLSTFTTYQRTWTAVSSTTTSLSCGWWFRSGQSQTTACMVNLATNVNVDSVENYMYGVRPCIVLNLM